ncbi:hypothetical protein [Capillimicrobium parvum]|uniref:Uncharacterized protein n=1 Tax=Capillimicrobium parvum TaxID=2884022 RepID=A0A9E6XUD9_9ACTN|nr:hypothetical protein [Capillimicrobium parvum]UGS34360.1 hypothetical protein DSM104329_00737 [Capillimicrobium parvum]
MGDDELTTEQLKAIQADRASSEDAEAQEAEMESDERVHRRRADKAAYLRDKLAEQAESDLEG